MIIGIAGFSKSGKNEAAKALTNFRKDSFAYQLKLEVSAMLETVGLRVDLSDPIEKELWRDTLVSWGKQRRKLYENYWIEPVEERYKKGSQDVVITDVRYLNEAQWILSQPDGHVIRIFRDGAGPANEEEKRSFSEITLHSCSNRFHNILNNFNKHHLYSEVTKVLNKIKPPIT